MIMVSKGIGMLRRMKTFVPQQTLISVYNAIILVVLFGITVKIIHSKSYKNYKIGLLPVIIFYIHSHTAP